MANILGSYGKVCLINYGDLFGILDREDTRGIITFLTKDEFEWLKEQFQSISYSTSRGFISKPYEKE